MTRHRVIRGGVVLLVVGLFASGCAINRATATLDPGANLHAIKKLHVVKHDKDKHGVNELIVLKLQDMGLKATTEGSVPADADALVTYADRWQWDITMYMLELTVQLRDPKDDFPIASGNSFHTSLTRKSPEEMVDEVLTNIFKQGEK